MEIHPTVVREGNSVTVIVHEQPQLHSDINIEYSTVEVTAEGGNTGNGACMHVCLEGRVSLVRVPPEAFF